MYAQVIGKLLPAGPERQHPQIRAHKVRRQYLMVDEFTFKHEHNTDRSNSLAVERPELGPIP